MINYYNISCNTNSNSGESNLRPLDYEPDVVTTRPFTPNKRGGGCLTSMSKKAFFCEVREQIVEPIGSNIFFFNPQDGIPDAQESRGLGDVYKRQQYKFEFRGIKPATSRL